jgi:signal transduction histidine kinase
MSEMSQQERYEKGLNFFGAIVRSLSHQLTNVLAIITELTGLIEDSLDAAGQGAALDPAKLRNAVGRIAKQLERGNGYIRQLNRFGHSVDHPATTMEAGEILERVMAYCQRFATLRKMSLSHSRPEADVAMEGSPFDLQHVLFRCLDAVLSASGEGAELAVALEAARGGARFTFSGPPAAQAGDEVSARLTLARQLVEAAGGTMDAAAGAGRELSLVVFLPATLRPLSAGAEGLEENPT